MLLSVPEELGIGFIAGLASRAISTPLSVITVRLQTETEGEDEDDELNTKKGSPHESREGLKRGSIIGTVQRLSEEEGLQGFWRGEHLGRPMLETSYQVINNTRIHDHHPALTQSCHHPVSLPGLPQNL